MGKAILPLPEKTEASPAPTLRHKLASVLVGVLAPVSIALVVGAVLVSEQAGPETELQLIAPAGARPGDRVALRANLLFRLDEPDGPTLTTAPVDVTLLDATERVRASARLAVSPAQSMEGALVVPPSLAPGRYMLVARGRSASVRAPLLVSADAPVAPAAPREVAPLAMLAQGPLLPTPPGDQPLPARSDARVVGATCVPEVPCTVLVSVGAPPADVSLAVTPSVEPIPARTVALGQPDVATLTALVHGPEAESELVFSRAGVELARRALRLPVALGEAQLEVASFALVGTAPRVRVLGAPRGRPIIVDVFAEGRWVYTRAFAAGALDAPRALPGFRFDRAVPHRVQARTDLFDSSAAASRYVYVNRTRDEEPPLDPLVSPSAERRERSVALREAAFYFASLDAERLATPVPVSGRDAAIARALAGRERVRVFAAVALLLLSGLLVLFLLERGLRASREARALLLEAGDANAESATNRRRDTLAVLAIVGAVVLAFVATLAFVLARLAANVG
jgi:hypothetical protein